MVFFDIKDYKLNYENVISVHKSIYFDSLEMACCD